MHYINYRYSSDTGNETIDHAETMQEAIKLLNEYQISDKFGNYWISSRKCKNTK